MVGLPGESLAISSGSGSGPATSVSGFCTAGNAAKPGLEKIQAAKGKTELPEANFPPNTKQVFSS